MWRLLLELFRGQNWYLRWPILLAKMPAALLLSYPAAYLIMKKIKKKLRAHDGLLS